MRIAAAALLLMLGACALPALTTPEANLDSIQAIRAAGLPALAVGAFTPAPGAPTRMDNTVMARAGMQSAPEGSFAKYLGDTLAAQLKGAGRLDPTAPSVVSGVITDTYLATERATSEGRLAARFTLTRGGHVVFEKTFSVSESWDSDFYGDVAIHDAFNHYAGFFPKLVAELLADKDFQAATRS